MIKNVLISLVSEQTIPIVEIIKEFGEKIDKHILVHTPQTINQTDWIINSTSIQNTQKIEVDAFDINEIEKKLNETEFPENNYYLNITGGTKLMILVFQEFFKNLGSKIYYVTGHNREYLKIFPVIGERKFKFTAKISLHEYLTAYGFDVNPSYPFKDYGLSKKILNFFLLNNIEDYKDQIVKIRLKRKQVLNYLEDESIKDFLEQIGFLPENPGILNKKETKYLSGDWFEEFIYYKIKEEFNLTEDDIGVGMKLSKKGIPNEMDVMFIYNHKLYIVECKTSLIDLRIDSSGKMKRYKLISEVIYKSDALRSKLGLFSNTSIFTLEEIKNDDGTPISDYEPHFERAELSRINIVSKKDFISEKTIQDLLKIK